MKAVNLVPVEERGGGTGSPIASYALIGVLALAVLAVTVVVLQGNSIKDRRTELAEVQSQNTAARAQAERLAPYAEFAALQQTRVQTVASLASSRFDWDTALSQLARVIPPDVWLQSYTGTVNPGVTVEGGASTTSSFRSASPDPAAEMTGCATSHRAVLRFVSRLRTMTGVTRVTLADAQKPDTVVTAPSGTGSETDGESTCDQDDSWPTFNIVVFYAPMTTAPAAPAAADPAAPVAASTTTTTEPTAAATR